MRQYFGTMDGLAEAHKKQIHAIIRSMRTAALDLFYRPRNLSEKYATVQY